MILTVSLGGLGMNETVLEAHAKVNLMLDVGGKRPDGFHEVSMILQTIALADRITIRKTEEAEIRLRITEPKPEGLSSEDNLMVRAAQLLNDLFGLTSGVEMTLEKHIPMAAGLGGGSSDAAAVLIGMNRLFELALEEEELEKLGSILGSDVPFFMRGGTQWARGRGELLLPLPDVKMQPVVLATPNKGVSTAEIYKRMDDLYAFPHPDTALAAERILNGENAEALFENVMERVTVSLLPEIGAMKDLMSRKGAKRALMSGSGPTVFGIFETEKEAENARICVQKAYPDATVTKTQTFPYGITIL